MHMACLLVRETAKLASSGGAGRRNPALKLGRRIRPPFQAGFVLPRDAANGLSQSAWCQRYAETALLRPQDVVVPASTPPLQPISREAGDKTQGFRFQKLRAAVRLLGRIPSSSSSQIFCALEFIEDSALFDADGTIALEENKSYTSALSFNSAAIKNTVVAFLDADAAFAYSKELRFGVYASATVAGERIPPARLPSPGGSPRSGTFSILKNLVAGVRLTDTEVAVAKTLIEDEYRSQYASGDRSPGHEPPFAAWTIGTFRHFLEKVDWEVGDHQAAAVEAEALDLIRKSPFFDHRHEGLEEFLLCALLDLLEKRSHEQSPIQRIVGTADVKNIFLEILAGRREDLLDPAHKEWHHEEPKDRRNLSEKVQAVSPAYPGDRLSRLARKIALARHERDAFGREYISLMLRVLHACQDELINLEGKLSHSMSESEVDACLEALVTASVGRMSKLSATWTYRVANEEAIRGAVLSLFDECYLAFDESVA